MIGSIKNNIALGPCAICSIGRDALSGLSSCRRLQLQSRSYLAKGIPTGSGALVKAHIANPDPRPVALTGFSS